MVDDVEALSLVRECRELEERYRSDFTSQILNAEEFTDSAGIVREAQDHILREDRTLLLDKVSKYQHLHKIAECVGWKKVWDQALDYGPSATKSMKNIVRVITYPDHATRTCPLCELTGLDRAYLAEHFTSHHTRSERPWNSLMDSLTNMDPSLFSHILCFLNVF